MRAALAVASECVPLVKTGGLADVVGALPAAMAGQGWRIRTLLPGYRQVLAALGTAPAVMVQSDLFGGPGRVLAGAAGGLDLLVLEAPHLYDRAGTPYLDLAGHDWPDNPERFAALAWMAARIATEGVEGWRPELLHLHDWQAGLAPAYLRARGDGVASLLTIHNIAFHGLAPADRLWRLRLPPEGFTPEGFEYYGHISALKAGLVFATRLSTVSPTYARELATPDFGMGLDGVIRSRARDLVGILNGIDTTIWDPSADPLVRPYRSPAGKAANRARLVAEFGLGPGEGPVCIVVSRLSDQKGLDLLLQAVPALTDRGGRLALLGAGDRGLENAWLRAAEGSDRIGVRIGYDEALAHRMFAGGDAVLVPSRFEPCGLTQLYGLRYGTIPLVALTGGLADTVIAANDAAIRAGVATGLQVWPPTAEALGAALARLCELHADRSVWDRMQRNAMRHPVGWAASAPAYARLYESAVAAP